jgi:plastocyanin
LPGRSTPARFPAGRRAGFLFVLLLGLTACRETPPPPVVLVVAGDTILLPQGARIHDIDVRVRAEGEFLPEAVEGRPGDVLRFTAGDGRGHALAFEAGERGDELLDFLERTGQRRGPPLLSAGAIWIVALAEAPQGSVRVVCLTHAERARLVVTPRPE